MGPSSSTVGLTGPPHWGPHSLQLLKGSHLQPSRAHSVCSFIGYRRNAKGFCGSRMCACMHLSLRLPVLQSPPFCVSSAGALFISSPPSIRLRFRSSPIVSPSATVFSLSNTLRLAPRFPPPSLGGNSVCGPVFELSMSKCLHVAPCTHPP